MKHKQIIWDFNGTLLDDVAETLDATNAVLARHGKPLLADADAYRHVFGFPVIDYYEKIGLERAHFEAYADEWVAEYNRRAPQAGLYPCCREALVYFRDAGCRQYLLSATEREMLAGQLAPLDIKSYFDDIVGQDDTRAHGKLAAAVEWSKKVKLYTALLVGDSLHDAEVAAAIGADCVLLACGHQSRARLEATGRRVFDTVADLLHAAEKGEL